MIPRMRCVFALLAIVLVTAATRADAAEPWTLARAVEFALTNSPDARLAEQRIAAARADLRAADAAFRPRVTFQSGYVRTDNPVAVFGASLNQRSFSSALNFNDVPDADNLNLKGLVTMPLYAGGQNPAAKAAATAGQAAARAEAGAVRAALTLEIACAYLGAHKASGFIRAAAASVASFRTNLVIAQRRHESGTALKTDVLDLDVRLAQAQEELVQAQHARALAERAVRTLMGWEEPEFALAAEQVSLLAPVIDDGAATRPEQEAAAQRSAAAEHGVRQSRAGFLPRLSGFGSLDYDRGWEFDGDNTSYTVGLLLELSLWDGDRTRANVAKARAQLAEAREAERKLAHTLDFETEQARLRLREADERLAVTARAVASATESAQLTRARFEEGLVLAAQLIDSETALTGARVRHEEAQADRQIAIAALRKALGLPVLVFHSTTK
jgi:outer membrane protein TolC